MRDENREDTAHHFIQLHLKSLPVTNETIEKELDGVSIKIQTNKTPLKREADILVKLDASYETLKFLSPNLNITPQYKKTKLVDFVYYHKEELEKIFNDII